MEEVIRGELGSLGERSEGDSGRPEHWKGRILDRIRTPSDLKGLDRAQLDQLCREIRDFLVDEIMPTGLDVASSLGVVELTVALESVLDLPKDRLVWDTGHQSLVHKLLTGRRAELVTTGRLGGLSKYPAREESPFDPFGAGHASTAISAALGMATARDLAHEDYRTVAVIGDGAMSGGMAFEALNNAGRSKRSLVVILNDNGESVNPKVGTIAHHLTSIRTNPHVMRLRDESLGLIERLPALGETVGDLAKKMEQAVKTALVPGALYEALGFNYIGPLDGHDLNAMLELLPKVVDRERPTLLHVLTQRGKGSEGRTSVALSRREEATRPSYTEVFGRAMLEAAEAFPSMVAITASLATGTGLAEFRKKQPQRYFDVGIAEAHGICFAAGLACDGARPVATISSSFLKRAYDQVVQEVAIQKLPVVFAQERAGLVGEPGVAHHGAFDLSYLRCVPNMTIAAPKDGNELGDLLWTALSQSGGPFAIRYPRSPVPRSWDAKRRPRVLPIGSWEVLHEGDRAALLAVGSMVEIAEEARELLRQQGKNVGLVNCRFVKPLDRKTLAELRKRYSVLVTVEENALLGGFGDGVLDALNDEGATLDGLIRRGLPDRFVTHGTRDQLLEEVQLTPKALCATVLEALADSTD